MKVLITGIPGSGKTSVIRELKRRGYVAFDLDDCDVCAHVHKETGEEEKYFEGAGSDWLENHRWLVRIPQLAELLESVPAEETQYFGGYIDKRQIGEIAPLFDRVYLLKPDDAIVDARLETRETGIANFAKTKEERDKIMSTRHKFENAWTNCGAIILQNHGTVEDVVERVAS